MHAFPGSTQETHYLDELCLIHCSMISVLFRMEYRTLAECSVLSGYTLMIVETPLHHLKLDSQSY